MVVVGDVEVGVGVGCAPRLAVRRPRGPCAAADRVVVVLSLSLFPSPPPFFLSLSSTHPLASRPSLLPPLLPSPRAAGFNQLDLPVYSDPDVLREKLLVAIREGGGFGLA